MALELFPSFSQSQQYVPCAVQMVLSGVGAQLFFSQAHSGRGCLNIFLNCLIDFYVKINLRKKKNVITLFFFYHM